MHWTRSLKTRGAAAALLVAAGGASLWASPASAATVSREQFSSEFAFNRCSGQCNSVYGEAPTQVFSFDRISVHAIATVPLSDGTQMYLDLTWQGTGVAERGGSTSRDIVPGQFAQRTVTAGLWGMRASRCHQTRRHDAVAGPNASVLGLP
jgi:hypothetical protein